MEDYQIVKNMLAQFCTMLHYLSDMTRNINKMKECIKSVMTMLDEELDRIDSTN